MRTEEGAGEVVKVYYLVANYDIEFVLKKINSVSQNSLIIWRTGYNHT